MSVRLIIVVLLALAISTLAYAVDESTAASSTAHLMRLTERAEQSDGILYAAAPINWDDFLSKTSVKETDEEELKEFISFDSSNLKQLLSDRADTSRRKRQVSEYERTLAMISTIHTKADESDARPRSYAGTFEGTRDNLRSLYENSASGTNSQAFDSASANSYINYLYQITGTKATPKNATQPMPATYPAVRYSSSDDSAIYNRFASESYQYKKDVVNPEISTQTPRGSSFNGSNENERASYLQSLSNIAKLNSLASDQKASEFNEMYPEIGSNLNLLLTGKEDNTYSKANMSSSLSAEYRYLYSDQSSKKHRSDKIAVVIGVNSYSGRTNLRACVNDAKAMAELLRELGYVVVELTDESPIKPTKENILNVGIPIIKNSQNKERIVFYFSGHGEVDDDGTFYMVPQNSNRDPKSYISEYELKRYLNDVKNLAIIIDACYSGGMKDLVSEGQILITSSKNEEPSNELWTGSMSVFTYNLVNAIRAELARRHELTLQECFYKAKEGTIKWSGKRFLKQNPIIVDKTGGDFRLL